MFNKYPSLKTTKPLMYSVIKLACKSQFTGDVKDSLLLAIFLKQLRSRLCPTLALMVFLLVACITPIENGLPIASATAIVLPSQTPVLTLAPIPTSTSQPTATASCLMQAESFATLQSAQDRMATLIPNVKVIWYDDFNCDELSKGWIVGHYNPTLRTSIANGIVTISAQKVENIWDGIGRSSKNLGDNTGMLMLFQYKAGTSAPLVVDTGEWQTPSYRSWGLSINNEIQKTIWEGWVGSNGLNSYFPGNVLRPDTLFYLLISRSDDGQVMMKVWEKDNPKNHVDFNKRMPTTWVGRRWASLFHVYHGMLEIDEYFEYSFEKP